MSKNNFFLHMCMHVCKVISHQTIKMKLKGLFKTLSCLIVATVPPSEGKSNLSSVTIEEAGVHGVNIQQDKKTTSSPSILFSMTTMLHLPEKEHFVRRALDSFIKHHPHHESLIDRWLILNEYNEDEKPNAACALAKIRKDFPFVEIHQKTASDRGQARSLNIILDELHAGDYAYWLHVEESWYTLRPFVHTAVKALDDHPHLHHLQLYHAAYYLNHTHTRISDDVKVVALNSHVDLASADPRNWRAYSLSWPSYSLRPSLTRVDFLRKHPELVFDTDPSNFPVIFELDFAIRWQLRGGSMCMLIPEAVERQEGHESTYTL